MQRLPAVLALVALAVPTSAGAKQVVALSLCGANGCHSTRDRQAVTAAMNAVSAADPNEAGPFFKLREVIGEPGQPGPIGQVRSWWIPSLEVIRNDNGGLAEFTQPQGAMKQALLGLSRGLRPFPAAKLPPEPGGAPPAGAPVVAPAAPSTHRDGGGGGGGWAWWLLLIVPAGIVLWLRRLA